MDDSNGFNDLNDSNDLKRRAKRWLIGFALFVAVIVFLVWPVGTWLQHRSVWLMQMNQETPDAMYLVAGARDQVRRIDALLNFVHVAGLSRPDKPDTVFPAILIGNDPHNSLWSREDQRNLETSEWSRKRIQRGLQATGGKRPLGSVGDWPVEIVPGEFSGTDGEMEALVTYLRNRSSIQSIALVTSPYHVRRAVWRLKKHLDNDIEVYAISAEAKLGDRMPWVTLSELAKMVRDCLGLSRVSLMSRGSVDDSRIIRD